MLCLDCRIGALVNVSDDDVSKVSNNNGRKLIESTKLLFDTFNELYYGFPFWKLWPTNAWNNLVKAETEIYEIASEYVDEAIRNLNDRDPNERQTVLETLLKTENLSIDEIKITIIDLIIGGIFTVSNSFAFLIYHLAAHPDVQHKILDEMRSISPFSDHLDEFESNLFSMEFINQMSYLKACVQECFRLNCPVPGIMRTTSKSIVLSGYEIPENVSFRNVIESIILINYGFYFFPLPRNRLLFSLISWPPVDLRNIFNNLIVSAQNVGLIQMRKRQFIRSHCYHLVMVIVFV